MKLIVIIEIIIMETEKGRGDSKQDKPDNGYATGRRKVKIKIVWGRLK